MRPWMFLAVCAALVPLPVRLRAQETTRCTLQQLPNTRISTVQLPSKEYNTFIGGSLLIRCPSRGITLKADSAELYGDEKRDFLVGHVNYDEPRLALTSDFLTYYTTDERIVAAGNVHGRLPTGSTLVGPQVDYKRAVPRIRTRALTLATGRPTVTIVQRDSAGKEQPPIDVIANTIFMDGDSLIYGSGEVQITRPEIKATSDSAFINSGTEIMQLMRAPVVNGTRGRPFKLIGNRIELYSKNRKLQRVLSMAQAQANSQDLTLRADTIDLRVETDQLVRAFAWGPSRAHANSPTQNMIADSLDVHLPAQRVREVRALRRAFAEGKPDSTIHADTTNWLRGDTIVAYFDTLPPVDTSKGPEIRKLVSTDSAEAYYNLAPSDTSLHRPAVNYVKGHEITINFDEQKVANIAVEGRVAGLYIEPSADTTTKTRTNPRPGNTRTPGTGRSPTRPGTGGIRRP
jgi:lipopolysaccharide export system protein LptA